MGQSVRMPGVFFEAVFPEPEERLPRMDVAAFVGFASAGPLHAPVRVEDPGEYRNVFLGDVELAWDEERGSRRRSHLGVAVESFFANGGQRCWAVRVADGDTAVRHRFPLPGLIDSDDRRSSPASLAEARARSVGSWSEELAVGTALSREPTSLVSSAWSGTTPLELAVGGYRIDLAVDPARLETGDLLEVAFGPGLPSLLLFVDDVRRIAGGSRILGSRSTDPGTGETIGAFWIESATTASPSVASIDETIPPVAITESDGLSRVSAFLGSPPAVSTLPSVRRLNFEMTVWKGEERIAQLSDLGFGGRHSRFWSLLPDDERLFRLPLGEEEPEAPKGLVREAQTPRFPIAGEESPASFYLPWGMGRQRTRDVALELDGSLITGTTLERDGLADFGAGLFLDPDLATLGSDTLRQEAEYRRFVLDRPLSGLHSLLPIREVSLVAAPDAVHRAWSTGLGSSMPTLLSAPVLEPIDGPDDAGVWTATWTAVDGADTYRLQQDDDPEFPAPKIACDGDQLKALLASAQGCPGDRFFRVRAERDGERGPWSNTERALMPPEPFEDCERDRPGSYRLMYTSAASPGAVLEWTASDPAESWASRFELQESADAGFFSAKAVSLDPLSFDSHVLPDRRTAGRYYRIRGVGNLPGPWSNTVYVGPTERAAFTEYPPTDYDPSDLLAVQLALIRFAAGRGDLSAVLGMPEHYRAVEAVEHARILTVADSSLTSSPPPLEAGVPHLAQGETWILSYASLYHPWVTTRSDDVQDEGPLRIQPPEGVASGMIAGMSNEFGAWIAPANRALGGIVALGTVFDAGAWSRLAEARINSLLDNPGGYLVLYESTLSPDLSLSQIHVRRLMILLRRLALREGNRLVFEPHGPQLQHRVRHQFERILADLFERGAFGSDDPNVAYRVVTDESVNPRQSVDLGRFVVEIQVLPAPAIHYLTVRLVNTSPGKLTVEEV